MAKPPAMTSDARPSSGEQLAGVLALAGGVFVGALLLAGEPWEGGQAPFPYAWRDVALVHLLCAAPLAWLATAFVRGRAAALALAVAALAVGLVPLLEGVRAGLLPALLAAPALGVVVRAVPALGLA